MITVFRRLWSFSKNGGAELPPDPELHGALRRLDPGEASPGYWFGFRRTVLLAAAPELARRRRLAEITVSDVVFSWSRTLVPAAMMAAVAAVFLVHSPDPGAGPLPLRLEEILREGLEASVADPVTELELEFSFASEVF